MEPTTEKLARALEEASAPSSMVQRARAGLYDDYKSELAMPIMQLVEDCRKHNLSRIAKRAKDGEFDATREEADEWAASEEGQQTIRDLLGGR